MNVNTQLEKKKLFKPSQSGRKLISFCIFFFVPKKNPGRGTAMQDMRARAHGKGSTVPAVNRSMLAADWALLQLESGDESKRSGRDVHTKSRRVGSNKKRERQ